MPARDTWRRMAAAGHCPRCRVSVPTGGRYLVWQARVCPGCGAMVRNAVGGRLFAAGLLGTGPLCMMLVPGPVAILVLVATQVLGLSLLLAFTYRMKLVAPGPFCPRCQYDLSASPGAACPECGEATGRTHAPPEGSA